MDMFEKRNIQIWGYQAVGLVGGIAILFVPLMALGRPASGHGIYPLVIVLMTLSSAAALGWVYVFARLSFRRMDEFVQQGSRVAWYWGGIAGLALSAPVAVFIALGGLHWLSPASPIGSPLARAFMLGYALPVVLQLAGFLIVASWWRLAKR